MTTSKDSETVLSGVANAVVVLREEISRAIKAGEADTVSTLATVIASLARAEAARDGPNPQLREWQGLVLDAAAASRALVPAAAEQLARAADAVRHTILLVARNPADQLASRPTSRRVLEAICELGGILCSHGKVRELANQNPTHFSNTVKILRAAGLVISESGHGDGRERRLSLTNQGRAALAAHVAERPATRLPPRLLVVARNRPHVDNHLRPAPRPDAGYRSPLELKAPAMAEEAAA